MFKKKHLLIFGLASLAVTASAVQAEEEFLDDRWYVAPFGTFVQPSGNRNIHNGWGGGMGIGKIINEYFNVEVRGFWQGLDGKNGGNYDFTGGSVDLQYYFMRGAFSPYAVVGVGGMNTSGASVGDNHRTGGGTSAASVLGEIGLGATYELADNFLLRADVRYRNNYEGGGGVWKHENDFNDMVVNAGFVIPFGEKPKPAEAPVAAAPTPECSTRDTDHDGVNDCDDKCPGTMAGAKVDDQGCPIRIELKGVNFNYNSAELTAGAKSILDGVAEQLIAFPEKKDIEVAGHTSSEGTNAYNMKLSIRRSQSVADYLKWAGVKNKLYPKGYGEDYPIADNKTEAGRDKNRRVELIWMGE